MTKQSRSMSLAESLLNLAAGLVFSLLAQIAIFPLVGIAASLAQNLWLMLAFSIVSVVRSFALRRVFEWLRVRADYDPYEEVH